MLNNKPYRYIFLTRSMVAIVDRKDLKLLSDRAWHVCKSSSGIYAVTNEGKRPERRKVYMHRLIMGVTDKRQIHHINGDTLDNRRCNLEVCSQQKNLHYRKKRGS